MAITAHPPTVSRAWVRQIIQHACRYGISPARLLRGAKCPVLPVSGRIPLDLTVRLWRTAAKLSHDPLFGLKMGASMQLHDFGVLAHLIFGAATLQQALDTLSRFQRLASDGGLFQQLQGPQGGWTIYHENPDSEDFCYHQIDAVIATLVIFARSLLSESARTGIAAATEQPQGRTIVVNRVIAVLLSHRRNAPLADYVAVLGQPPRFSAEFNGVLFSREQLDRVLPQRDPELQQVHEQVAFKRLASLDDEETLLELVSAVIRELLVKKCCCRAAVARKLSLSERTLQRRLTAQGTGFRQLRRSGAQQLARTWLAQPETTVAAVAAQLGYSEASAFNHAFKQWYGVAPLNWQRHQRAQITAENTSAQHPVMGTGELRR